jgi:HlyD family secretion protein
VWVLQDGRVQPRLVRLGLRTLDAAEVLQGLAAGDTVLLGSGAAPGRKVRADTSAGRPPLDGSARAAGESAAAALTGAMGR